MFSDTQKIGVVLTALGVFFTVVGVLFFFDKGFLTIGNVSFLAGVTLSLGVRKIKKFFLQKKKIKGSICFFVGIALVLFGWALIGICVELFGFINLFGDFFPNRTSCIAKTTCYRKYFRNTNN